MLLTLLNFVFHDFWSFIFGSEYNSRFSFYCQLNYSGGRGNLCDLQSWIFYVGGTSGLIGNYLSTSGRSNNEDLQMIEDLELEWQGNRVEDLDLTIPEAESTPPAKG